MLSYNIIKKSFSMAKAYKRISPSSKILMKKHGINENTFDSRRVINKDYILQLIDKMNDIKIEKKDEIVINSQKLQNTFNLKLNMEENKNYLPHTYYENTANLDNLMAFLENINSKQKKDLKIEDFISKVLSNLIEKLNLKIIYDIDRNKYYKSDNVVISSTTFDNGKKQEYYYIQSHKYNLADISSSKFIKEITFRIKPNIKIFNYSSLNIQSIDEIIQPPSLMSLTIGKITKRCEIDENNKIKIVNTTTIKLTGVSTVFNDEDLINLLHQTCNYVTNPITISL